MRSRATSATLPMAAPTAATLTLGADCVAWMEGSKVGILPPDPVDDVTRENDPSGVNDEFVRDVLTPADVEDVELDVEDDADGFNEEPAEGVVGVTS